MRYNYTTYLNYCKTIDIGEGIPRDLERKKKKKRIFLLHLNEFNLKDGFENYIVAEIFDAPSNKKKGKNKNIYIHNPICYINSFCCTIPKLTKIKK